MDEDCVVTAAWLDDHRDDADVVVVDVREPWEYDGIGHVPGAVNVPFETFRSEESEAPGVGDVGMLPAESTWTDLLVAAGVEPGDALVAYDDTHGVFAARFLVTALLYGHDRLHLLDGDYTSWAREHPTATAEPDVTPTTYEVSEPETSPLVTADDVAAAAADPDAVVVDTRSASEFDEAHIPGSVHLDWRALVDEETRGLKPRAELEALLAERGITHDQRVILYCNTARRISHTYVVLQWLGYDGVGFYEGSLTEWRAAGRPLEEG